MNFSNRIGAFTCLSRFYLGISATEAANTLGVCKSSFAEYERRFAPFSEELLVKYLKLLNCPASILKTLNDEMATDNQQKIELYNLLDFLHKQQNESTEINIILCMIRLVSGFFKATDFVKEIKAPYEENYGLTQIKDIDKRTLKHIEIATQPTLEQLLFYATFLRIRVDILSFWNDSNLLKKASLSKKRESLYIICSAAYDAYLHHYLK